MDLAEAHLKPWRSQADSRLAAQRLAVSARPECPGALMSADDLRSTSIAVLLRHHGRLAAARTNRYR